MAAVMGALVGVLFQLPPLADWRDSLSGHWWLALPWLVLMLVWATMRVARSRRGRDKSAD